MKAKSYWVLALLVGFGAGVATTQGLQAQRKAPAYYVAEVEVIGDLEAYQRDYVPKVIASTTEFGGTTLVGGHEPLAIEGDPPKQRAAIVRFDSMDDLLAWRNSDRYKENRKISDKYARVRAYAVEGSTD